MTKMNRGAVVALLVSALAAATLPPIPRGSHRAYMPVAVGWPALLPPTTLPPLVTPTPGPTIAPTQRPGTYEEIRRAVSVAGSSTFPAPGLYHLSRPLQMAQGSTLDGRGAVVLEGEGILVYKASNVTIRGLEVRGADGDGISVNMSGGVLIERVLVSGWGDGGIDIVRTPSMSAPHILRHVTLSGGAKGMLLGHQLSPTDGDMVVRLEDVNFDQVGIRTPKVHRAHVVITGGVVRGWRGPRLDVQLGGTVNATGTRWEAGSKSEMGVKLLTGGSVVERGAVLVPVRGGL